MLKNSITGPGVSKGLQLSFAFLCLFVYAGSLFFPLMDKDAAHHANIALYMYEHDNWINLVDRQKDYLDKPHFLFWSSLLSFKIFGVNTFAHRLPALVFALISIYSTYQLAKHLAGRRTATLAAVILATAQAFVLSINDARMETPLTAGIIFGLWHLVVYIDRQKFLNIVLAALGAAIAFATKGWIGPVVMFVPAFFYILFHNKWRVLASFKTWAFVPLFFLLISPVLYAYYVQFDLHPEKIIREKSGRSGIHFILWDQLFERSSGFDQGKKGRNSDYFFLYHTFLWAFFPWSILAYAAVVAWLGKLRRNKTWQQPFSFAVAGFAFLLFSISFSNFKMPHYVIMLLPLAAMFTAAFLISIFDSSAALKWIYPLQMTLGIITLVLVSAINFYFFPVNSIVVFIILVYIYILFLKKFSSRTIKVLAVSAGMSLLLNFVLNYHFFPKLLKYQGGNQLVKEFEKLPVKPHRDSIVLMETNAHSFDYYMNHNHQITSPGEAIAQYDSSRNYYYLMTNHQAAWIREQGMMVEPLVKHIDYNVTTITLKFLDPRTRYRSMDTLMLARLVKP